MYEVLAVRMMRWPEAHALLSSNSLFYYPEFLIEGTLTWAVRILNRFVSLRPNLMSQRNASALNSGKFPARINCVHLPIFKFTVH